MKERLKDLIFYEIYPNSFKDDNGDGYGDFKGIISKLEYVKSLGVNAIWLNPHYDSPFKDGGYDVRDYFHASSRFGSDDEFKEMLDKIHELGMKLIIDLVPGHTSEENEMFLKSASPERNEYSDMFIWTDNPWVFDSKYRLLNGRFDRHGSYLVNFFQTQPAINYGFNIIDEPWQISYKDERVKKSREFIVKVCKHYLAMGVDGFRVDMADSLVKNDGDEKLATMEIWQEMFASIRKDYPDAIFVSEWANPYKALRCGFDIDFHLERWDSFYNDLARIEDRGIGKISFLKPDSDLDIREHLRTVERSINDTKDDGYISFISGNHDISRAGAYLNRKELRLFFAFLLTMPGIPFIYYGDEIGMRYQKDLASKECGYHRTGARTPMPWDNSKNQGFSTCKKEDLFLPMDGTTCVEDQINDKNSLLNFVKKMIEYRKNDESLKGNNFKADYSSKDYLMYYRNDEIIVINPKKYVVSVEVSEGKVNFFDGSCKVENGKLIVGPSTIVIYKQNVH